MKHTANSYSIKARFSHWECKYSGTSLSHHLSKATTSLMRLLNQNPDWFHSQIISETSRKRPLPPSSSSLENMQTSRHSTYCTFRHVCLLCSTPLTYSLTYPSNHSLVHIHTRTKHLVFLSAWMCLIVDMRVCAWNSLSRPKGSFAGFCCCFVCFLFLFFGLVDVPLVNKSKHNINSCLDSG